MQAILLAHKTSPCCRHTPQGVAYDCRALVLLLSAASARVNAPIKPRIDGKEKTGGGAVDWMHVSACMYVMVCDMV